MATAARRQRRPVANHPARPAAQPAPSPHLLLLGKLGHAWGGQPPQGSCRGATLDRFAHSGCLVLQLEQCMGPWNCARRVEGVGGAAGLAFVPTNVLLLAPAGTGRHGKVRRRIAACDWQLHRGAPDPLTAGAPTLLDLQLGISTALDALALLHSAYCKQ